MDEPQYLEAVVFVIGFLMDLHPQQSDISAGAIERAVWVAGGL